MADTGKRRRVSARTGVKSEEADSKPQAKASIHPPSDPPSSHESENEDVEPVAKKAKKGKGKGKAEDAGSSTTTTESLEDHIESMKAVWERAKKTGKFVGAHVSASGGVQNAPINAAKIGAAGFALFLKNQRQWNFNPLEDATKEAWKTNSAALQFDSRHVLPHGSYLVNMCNADASKRQKAYETFEDDLKRCDELQIKYHNFHPGSTCGEITPDESIELLAACIDRAHAATKQVVVVLENCAGSANTIGSFEDLGKIIAKVQDRTRIGVCLDTCHAFAAGHDLRTKEAYEETMRQFDQLVGFKYLRGVHLNDSKGELGCKKDRHENIGKGMIGLEGFRCLMNDKRFDGIPIVLETPEDKKDSVEGYRKEIDLLYSLVE